MKLPQITILLFVLWIAAGSGSAGSSSTVTSSSFVSVCVKKAILQFSKKEVLSLKKFFQSQLKLKKGSVKTVKIITKTECRIIFARSVKVSVARSAATRLKGKSIRSVSGKTSKISSSCTVFIATRLKVVTSKGILKQTQKEVNFQITETAKMFNVQKTAIVSLVITSSTMCVISSSSVISQTQVNQLQEATVRSESGQTSTIQSATFIDASTTSVSQAVAPAPAAGGGGGGGGCLAGSVTVQTPYGSKLMKDLKTGDKIKVKEGLIQAYQPVKIWLHHDTQKRIKFLNIRTATNRSLLISERHLLPLFPECVLPGKAPRPAEDISYAAQMVAAHAAPGMCVLVMDGDKAVLEPISSVTSEYHTGVYDPFVDGDTFLADGIMVSCFSETGDNDFFALSGAFNVLSWPYYFVMNIMKFLRVPIHEMAETYPMLFHAFSSIPELMLQ